LAREWRTVMAVPFLSGISRGRQAVTGQCGFAGLGLHRVLRGDLLVHVQRGSCQSTPVLDSLVADELHA